MIEINNHETLLKEFERFAFTECGMDRSDDGGFVKLQDAIDAAVAFGMRCILTERKRCFDICADVESKFWIGDEGQIAAATIATSIEAGGSEKDRNLRSA